MKFEKGMAYIKAEEVSVSEVNVIPWKVGKLRRQEVSRGFRLSFEIPALSEDAWKQLFKETSANGWLMRLRRKSAVRSETLGYFSMEMVSPKPGSSNIFRYNSSKKASIGIYYAASSVSTRLDQLPCPAFNHRFEIEETDIKSNHFGERFWGTSPSDRQSISAKVERIGYSPININGGTKLEGTYHIDIALFDTRGKQRMSSYVELSNYGEIVKEETQVIKGCENFTVPKRQNYDPAKKFKFGR